MTAEDRPTTILRAGTPAVVGLGQRVTVVEPDGATHTGIVDSVSTDGSFTFSQRQTSPVVGKWLEPAAWPDQPASADTAVEQLEVHHARGRQRTDEEQAVLAPKMATGGVVRSWPAIVGDVTR